MIPMKMFKMPIQSDSFILPLRFYAAHQRGDKPDLTVIHPNDGLDARLVPLF